ncbi:hemagglutinin repeat-containing protein, partial [Fusobacterium massiliense]|uniref:hemagglutinin repeat-containing protein n=1 Tax=Fusobacterium massiliense TaxID=1852365 RepID=UPI0009F22651
TGIVSGLASNQGTKLPTSAVNKNNSNDDDDDDDNDKNNQTNTVGKDNLKAAQATNNFYANVGVNFGYTKSSSKTNSHNESAVVTTIRGKDENSSITYNAVKNVEYVGTQAQDTKFIYNNVENITKKAVELNNSYSSTGKSSGISTGVTIGYGDGIQTEGNGVSISASKSKMNTNGTTYQNGRFVNVDEVHNNTKNMTLSGFNQEGGTVTGNIENLTIESKQNTSITKGRTIGGSLSIAPNGMPSGSANYSQTNGERRVVDNASTFIIGDGSNLKAGKVENTASAIGTSGNGKLSIDEYVGHDLENVDKLKTVGGSVGVSASGITSLGVNYSDRKQEGITKNTVIGNVEIGKSSGDEINKDLDTMTEITEDRDFKTDINIESQTIKYALNPGQFKEDLQKAKNEIHDIYHAVDSTVNLQGKEDRNILEQLGEVRQAKTIYNVIDSRLQEAENQEDIAKAFEGVSEDLDYKVKVIYTDPSKSPQLIGVDKKGNTYIKNGTAYVDKKTGIGYILVNTKSPANSTKAGVIGTIAEEQSHVIGKKEGRQKVVPDGSEKGLESLGKPTNDYFKKQYSKNDKAIELKSDGKDYSNVDFGEHVGDSGGFAELKGIFLDKIVGTEDTLISAKDYLPMEFQIREKKIKNILEKEKNNISSKMVHEELIKLGQVGGQNIIKNKYEGIYVLENEDIRKQFFDEKDNLRLDKFDPENWGKIENSKKFKEGVEEVRKKSQEYYLKNKNIIKTEAIAKINTVVKLAGDTDIFTDNDLKFALGKTTITSRIIIDRGVPYLRYNLTDKFQDPADINIEWGKPYQMLGPSRIIPLFDVMGLEK